jgi:sulfoxide reductase catalytic subunit YedY
MHVIRRRGWEIPEHHATPEHLFLDRRAFLAAAGMAATGVAAISLSPTLALAQRVADVPDPTADLYPVKRNEKYVLDRPITDEKINTNYNNFYEFGTSKQIARNAQALKLRPWTVKIDGMVENAQEIGLDDLIRKMPLEERLYRHRCVEAWGMAIPWSGFPLAKLVELAKPLSAAKYLRMETFLDPTVAPAQKARRCGWRCRGSMASNRSSRSRVSPSRTSDPRPIGRPCRRRNMASGRTSIRRCRIRAGARRASP